MKITLNIEVASKALEDCILEQIALAKPKIYLELAFETAIAAMCQAKARDVLCHIGKVER